MTAAHRLQAEQGRKRVNPAWILIGLIVVGFLAAMGFIFLGDRNKDFVPARFDELLKEAARCEAEEDFAGAISAFKEAIRLVEGMEEYEGRIMEIKARIKEAERKKVGKARLQAEYDEFRRMNGDDFESLVRRVKKGKELLQRVEGWKFVSKEDLAGAAADLEKRAGELRKEMKKREFSEYLSEWGKKYGLKDREGGALWGGAIGEVRRYMAEEKNADDRARAEKEVVRLKALACEDFDRFHRKARRLAEVGRKAEAVDLLRQQRPRFAGTGFDK